jgi:hypothetical protein
MELRGDCDMVLLIRISELGNRIVPCFGVDGVLIVGEQAFRGARFSAWLS